MNIPISDNFSLSISPLIYAGEPRLKCGDMSVFESSDKLVGGAGLCPRNDESAGKYKSTATTKGNKYLRSTLVQASWGACRMKGSFFKEKFNRLAIRKLSKKALIAIARKLLVVIWNVLRHKKEYNPLLVPVQDLVKMKTRLAYHNKEYEKTAKLLNVTA